MQQYAEDLGERMILPLLVGGEVRPVDPIGERRAVAIAEVPPSIVGDFGSTIDAARLAVARRLWPVDTLPPFDTSDWLLVCALNDLLQATNSTLVGVFGRDRPRRLFAMADALVGRAGPPRTAAQALARHSLFSRITELGRVDTHVAWWVGSESFYGTKPPSRLLRWETVRRVRQQETRTALCDLPLDDAWEGAWRAVLRRWIAASPLTDLATHARRAPPFSITGSIASLVSTHAGRTLALRTMERSENASTGARNLRGAAESTAAASPEAARNLSRFADEVDARLGSTREART